jgi:hypothetical protein
VVIRARRRESGEDCRVGWCVMTTAGRFGEQTTDHPRSPRRAARRSVESEAGFSAEVASQVGDALTQLGVRLCDPAVAHSVPELQHVTRGFSTAVDGMAHGLGGITEWLRAAGYSGPVSAHSSVVADRLAHVGRELAMLAEAIDEAQRRAL